MSAAPTAKVVVPMAFEQRADAAAAAVLRRLADVIDGNRAGAIADADSEFLHRLRISVRRSRTVQRQLASVFPPLDLPGFRSEFRWLQRATGEARDLDVYLLGFEDCARWSPRRCGPTWTRCARCSSTGGCTHTGRWLVRSAHGAPTSC